jgi:molecular chaperone DnaJ
MGGKGHVSAAGGLAGDVLINIVVKNHPVFNREGYDIYSKIPISVSRAVLGGAIDVSTLYGDVELKIAAGLDTGVKKRLSSYGIQNLPPN